MTRPPKESVYDVTHERKHAAALKALQNGAATPDQQKLALDWFINGACRTYEPTYRSERPYDTAFAEGRRYAGLSTVKLLMINNDVYGDSHAPD